jgi:sugar transferase (PEP-CTERM system associated)
MIRLLRELIPSNVLILLITEATVVFCCYILASYAVLEVDPVVYLVYDGGLGRVLITELTILLAMYLQDLYSEVQVKSRMVLVQQICQAMGIAFLAQALLGYVNADLILPRWLMLTGSGLSLVTVLSWRVFYSTFLLGAIGGQRILLLGTNDLVVEIARHLAGRPEHGMRVVGYVEAGPGGAAPPDGLVRLGAAADLRDVVQRARPDYVVVGTRERRGNVPMMDLLELRFSGIKIEEAAAAYENVFKRVSLHELRPSQLVYSGELGPRPGNVALQMGYSALIALVATLLCAPLMLLVALAVRLTSRGPVLYRQTRVGWQGRHFTLYKFRSMYENAEAETGAVWALENDPRVTPVGRWLRRLRLDELPQFLNVLRGEMSLVGPRPERPEFVDKLIEQIPFYRQRHCVRPGITGWAQINHPYGDSMEDAARKLEYDLYYIKHLSPALDAFILFHTLKTVLLSRGAR